MLSREPTTYELKSADGSPAGVVVVSSDGLELNNVSKSAMQQEERELATAKGKVSIGQDKDKIKRNKGDEQEEDADDEVPYAWMHHMLLNDDGKSDPVDGSGEGPPSRLAHHTMRAELIGHFQPCMTDIYLHTVARMADYIRTHPYPPHTNSLDPIESLPALRCVALLAQSSITLWAHTRSLRSSRCTTDCRRLRCV